MFPTCNLQTEIHSFKVKHQVCKTLFECRVKDLGTHVERVFRLGPLKLQSPNHVKDSFTGNWSLWIQIKYLQTLVLHLQAPLGMETNEVSIRFWCIRQLEKSSTLSQQWLLYLSLGFLQLKIIKINSYNSNQHRSCKFHGHFHGYTVTKVGLWECCH